MLQTSTNATPAQTSVRSFVTTLQAATGAAVPKVTNSTTVVSTVTVRIRSFPSMRCLFIKLVTSQQIFLCKQYATDLDSITTKTVTMRCTTHLCLTSFQDIDECALDVDHCSDICTDEEGSYKCSCTNGSSLFEFDGYNDFSVAPGETGQEAGDVYQIGHTCVSKYQIGCTCVSKYQTDTPQSVSNRLATSLSVNNILAKQVSVCDKMVTCDRGVSLPAVLTTRELAVGVQYVDPRRVDPASVT